LAPITLSRLVSLSVRKILVTRIIRIAIVKGTGPLDATGCKWLRLTFVLTSFRKAYLLSNLKYQFKICADYNSQEYGIRYTSKGYSNARTCMHLSGHQYSRTDN